jgi:general secretion pathway protein C
VRHRSAFLLVAGTLALCAWLQARGVAAVIGGGLAAPAVRGLPDAPAALDPAPPRTADPILARNPFDSVTGPLVGAPPAPPPEPSGETAAACDGVRVVSIVAADDPDWSLVELELRGEREPILRRRGADVLSIRPERVLLRRDGALCVASLFPPPGGAQAKPPPAPAAAARGIVPNGPGSFLLDRAARDALIDGAAGLMPSVAVRPEKQGDDVVGLRIATLKPGTALDALGIRAGDVLGSLDGIPLTSPDRMLQAYARVRTEERVRVVVLRDGRPIQLDYQVR